MNVRLRKTEGGEDGSKGAYGGGGFKGKRRGGWENSTGERCRHEWQGVWEAVVSGESQFLYPSHSADTPLPGPSRPLPPLSPAPCSVPREGTEVLALASPFPVTARQSGQRGLYQPPVVRVRAATSGLMSQQAFSQILSLFSFLLHEMGIVNEKQRGAGWKSGGTELLACQT